MPLFAGSVTILPPAPVPDIPPVPFRQDVGTMRATWTDPTGVAWPLSDISPERGYFTTRQIAGWGAQPYEIVTDPMSRGGESVRYIRPQPARLTWPLHIWGETHQQFIERYRALRKAFLATVHLSMPGLLTVARPDGSARAVEAYYEDGWTGEGGENWLSANPVLTLFCPDGAWRDVVRTVVRRGASATVPFADPFMTLSSSQTLGTTEIDNPGDITAWPEWTIFGPCTGLVATNTTLNQSFTLTHTLSTGQTATITTDRPTVRGNAGENISGSLNWPSAYLWGLRPGINNITFNVLGSGATSAIELGFYPRYEGA